MSTVDVIIYVGQASCTSKETIVPKGMWTLFYSFCVSVSLFTFIIAVKQTKACWFSYIAVTSRCPCGFTVGDQ